jgi:transposase InsO family protein
VIRPLGGKQELLRAEHPHHVWTIDFKVDQTMDGRTLKVLKVIDEYSQLVLAIRVSRRCRAAELLS